MRKVHGKYLVSFMAIIALALFAFSCAPNGSGPSGSANVKGDTTVTSEQLKDGALADVHFDILADGFLYATSIDMAQAGESNGGDDTGDQEGDYQDDEGDQGENEGDDSAEVEDGDDTGDQGENEGDDQEGDHQDDEQNGQTDDEGDQFVEEFGGQVESIAADFSSFTVFSGMIVMEEADTAGGDPEQSGDLGIADLQVGMWVEVAGAYGYADENQSGDTPDVQDPQDGETQDGLDNVFYAAEIRPLSDHLNSIDSMIQDLTSSNFTMMGLTISYDANTVLNPEENDDNQQG